MMETLGNSEINERQEIIDETRDALDELHSDVLGHTQDTGDYNTNLNNSKDLVDVNSIPSAQTLFDNIIKGVYDSDFLGKTKELGIRQLVAQYIKDPNNKGYIINQYISNISSSPEWIEKMITDIYSIEEIGEYELKEFFSKNYNIVALGKSIIGPDWDGNNINDNKINSNICQGVFFTEKQLISEFNRKNNERISNNTRIMKNIDLYNFIKENLSVKKKKGILYINDVVINEKSLLGNDNLFNALNKKGFVNMVNIGELQKTFKNIYEDNIQHTLYKQIYDTTEESDNNYIFHDSGLDFLTESELKDEKTILENFKRNIGSKDNIDVLRSKNPDLPKIMAELKINEEDTPDVKHEKSRLIYLLNNGLFRGFLLAINCLDQSGVNCCSSSPYLKNDVAYNGLIKRLNRYNKEKDEKFYQLINDINNININFSSPLIKNSTIEAHLRNPNKKNNIEQVVGLAKSFFIQRIKNGETSNINIETYKNQLAYILATMELENGYNYAAKSSSGKYLGYGQIDHSYTQLRTIFAQGSGLDIGLKDRSGNAIVGSDIKVTEQTFTEKNFSAFAFVYGLTYGHLSNQGNLDRYINDNNVNNPDYVGARKVEAGVNSPEYKRLTKLWKNIINDSIS